MGDGRSACGTHLICMDLKKVAMHAGEGALRADASFFISFSLGYGSASYAAHSLACTCGEAFAYHLPAARHRVEERAPVRRTQGAMATVGRSVST